MLSKRQKNELWNLKAILEGGCHDDGQPLSAGERRELADLIAMMEAK
jgi:hypothetical protein